MHLSSRPRVGVWWVVAGGVGTADGVTSFQAGVRWRHLGMGPLRSSSPIAKLFT